MWISCHPGNFSRLAKRYLTRKVNHKLVGEGPGSGGGIVGM